jgi:FixJ family two-component response regulator
VTEPERLPTICVVDDDAAVRKSLVRVLRAHGFAVEVADSSEAFLARLDADPPACLILDVNLPELDGLELQRRLAEDGRSVPIVFLTGHGDIPTSVRAIKNGAVDFLTKPVSAEILIAAVRAALENDASERLARSEDAELRRRFQCLSSREREVLAGLVAGKLNKQVAADLGIAEQTVKFHRARIMERMQAKSAAELMLFAAKLSIR